jgi:hypothetical protein
VDRRERERIMWQGVPRPETPRDRRDREALQTDVGDSPLRGRELPARLRNFRPDAGAYLASLGGPLPYMSRLRAIDVLVAEHEQRLLQELETLGHDPHALRDLAERWDFGEVNELIDQHNRWYPIEARLPMDPATGDYALVNGRSYRREPLDARWVLARLRSRAA